jgi:hypothetical protein
MLPARDFPSQPSPPADDLPADWETLAAPDPDLVAAVQQMYVELPPWLIAPFLGDRTPIPDTLPVPASAVTQPHTILLPTVLVTHGLPWEAQLEGHRDSPNTSKATVRFRCGRDWVSVGHQPGGRTTLSWRHHEAHHLSPFAGTSIVWDPDVGAWRRAELPRTEWVTPPTDDPIWERVARVRDPGQRRALLNLWLGHPSPGLAALGLALVRAETMTNTRAPA